jgi:hypothetical protein
VTALWRIVEAAISSPKPLPAQMQRDIVQRVRELEKAARPAKTTSVELQAAVEAQAAEGESFRGPNIGPDADRRKIRRQLAEKRYAQKVAADLASGKRCDEVAKRRRRAA